MQKLLCNNSGVEAVDNQAILLPLLKNLLSSLPFLKQSIALPRAPFQGASFLWDSAFRPCSAGPGVQLRLQFRYTSKLAAVCVTKFTLGYMAFGNATREQPVASCHQAAINTIKNLPRSYSQKLSDHLLLIKYS